MNSIEEKVILDSSNPVKITSYKFDSSSTAVAVWAGPAVKAAKSRFHAFSNFLESSPASTTVNLLNCSTSA